MCAALRPSVAPITVERSGEVLYIDVGEIQISIDADGEILITCPPELLPAAAAAWADPRVQAAVARAHPCRATLAA